MDRQSGRNIYLSSLFGGGVAGIVVDVSLFPLDTIKTRLQCRDGFHKSGGFKNVYKGIGPQVLGSAPQAALFFCTYEMFKANVSPRVDQSMLPFVHMIGASIGEMVSCIIRVPVEVVKQRRQTTKLLSSYQIAVQAYSMEGFKGFYRGFLSTIIREVPFSLIQFPILEYLKLKYRQQVKNDQVLFPWEVAVCGAIAGGISAAVTTPLDVIKTRIMLDDAHGSQLKVTSMASHIYNTNGIKGLFSGVVPRTTWITIGGFIFFGMYDLSKNMFFTYVLGEEYISN